MKEYLLCLMMMEVLVESYLSKVQTFTPVQVNTQTQ
jgi:hypothetical protein